MTEPRGHDGRWEPLSPYLTDPLLRELIPQRPTPAPSTHRGPTAQWAEAHPDDPLHSEPEPTPARHLKAIGE